VFSQYSRECGDKTMYDARSGLFFVEKGAHCLPQPFGSVAANYECRNGGSITNKKRAIELHRNPIVKFVAK